MGKGVYVETLQSDIPNSPGDFYALIAEVLAHLAKSPASDLDLEVGRAFRCVCEFLEVAGAGLWWRTAKDSDDFTLMHLYPASEVLVATAGASQACASDGHIFSTVRTGMGASECFPWMAGQAKRGERIVFSRLSALPAEAEHDRRALAALEIASGVVVPFFSEGQVLGAASFGLEGEQEEWPSAVLGCLAFVSQILGGVIARKLAEEGLHASYAEIKELSERLQAESNYLKEEIKVSQRDGDVVGNSQAIQMVLHQAEQVGVTDSTVLITGETGTGKELIANAIHRLSLRKGKLMVRVNCAALPSALVESELFGRERGAYTGALTRQAGRFEIADGSTLFLDEVGELSLEVQAKLLRVLETGEFERLGSCRTIKVNVRMVCATNRDLAEEVRKGRFREDLYYRLNVFPIKIPPLRERRDDIPELVWAFLQEFSKRMGRNITRIPRRAVESLQRYHWPGNVRQLKNVIEHSVIVSRGETLKVSMPEESLASGAKPAALAEMEREYILQTLKAVGWRIKGPQGAAGILGMKPSTLYTRMEKLGIRRGC